MVSVILNSGLISDESSYFTDDLRVNRLLVKLRCSSVTILVKKH